MNILGLENEHHSMDVLNKEQIKTLEDALHLMCRKLSISEIDYEKGLITLGYLYNEGSKNQFVQYDFMKVNVAAESIPCLFWEVTNAVFHKCV